MTLFTMQQIFVAAKKGDLAFFKTQKVEEDATDDDGANCLHYAARGGHLELAKYLTETLNFDLSKKTKYGSTIFHDAAATGSLDVIKWLWSKTELNVDEGDNEGATPLHVAALYGQVLVVHWIIDNTSCELLSKTENGALCLHFAVVSGNLKVTKLILTEIPRSVNTQMKNGATAAYLACQFGHLDILKCLVEKNANVKSIKTFDGMSCLHAACQGGHLDIVKYLVTEQGCNPNDRDLDGASCLHFAATNGRAAVVAWMIKTGKAKVSLDNLGGSPLHNAAELGHYEVIKALLDNSCSVDITDNDGLTAAELAEKCHQPNCAALIRGENSASDNPEIVVESQYISTPPTNGHVSPHRLDKRRSPTPVSSQSDHSFENYHQTSPHTNIREPVQTTSGINPSTTFEQEEYIVPEEDYPVSDEDDLESSFIIHSPPIPTENNTTVADYESKQIDPNKYEPPDLPPDTGSEKEDDHKSDVSGRASSQSATVNTNKPKETPVTSDLKPPSRPGSALSSAASTLSSPRQNDLNRSFASESSVRFAVIDQIIDAQSQSSLKDAKQLVDSIQQESPLISPTSESSFVESSPSSPPQHLLPSPLPHRIPTPPPFLPSPPVSSRSTSIPSPSSASVFKKYPSSPRTQGLGNMAEAVANRNSLLSELKQLHSSRSDTNLNEQGDQDETPVEYRNGRTSEDILRPASFTNGDVNRSPRSSSLSPASSSGSLYSQGHQSIGGNMDLLNELKNKDPSELKVTRKPHETKQAKMVFSFGDPSPSPAAPSSPTVPKSNPRGQISTKSSELKAIKTKLPTEALKGDFDPKNFLDQVPENDASGKPYPAWKKQLLARQIADKAKIEAEEKKKEEDYEARFKNMPLWKRQMIERKEAQQKK